jgi:CheY-like chemotaxis protein
VLLVEPDADSRDSLGALLAQSGARVMVAASGPEAIAHLEAESVADPVIVCDIAVPGDEGYAELARIRAWERERGAAPRAAIALSAFIEREDRMRALAHGFSMHLAKPVVPAELVLGIASVARGVRV